METDSPTDPTASGANSADELERELSVLLGRAEPPPAAGSGTSDARRDTRQAVRQGGDDQAQPRREPEPEAVSHGDERL